MAADAATICDELEAMIQLYMNDVAWVEAVKRATAMIVHFNDGSEAYIEVTTDGG